MNRPQLVRSIYTELRQGAGDVANAAELLQAASVIAETLVVDERVGDRGMCFRTGGVPFDQWALDRAMSDGGWRILRYERELAQSPTEDEQESWSSDIAAREWMMENAA
jgi:hypothetical protein